MRVSSFPSSSPQVIMKFADIQLTQIMAEMQHNQIRLYPFDAEENDDEELQLNERIRVSSRFQMRSLQWSQRQSQTRSSANPAIS